MVVQEANQRESMGPEGPLPVGNCIINMLLGARFFKKLDLLVLWGNFALLSELKSLMHSIL